jgi:hypothetical protein
VKLIAPFAPLLSTNPDFVSKRIDDKTFDKFVQDVKSLRAFYTDAKISSLMGTNPGNFSSRVNGAKRLGQDFIDKFYLFWDSELIEIAEGGEYYDKERKLSASFNSEQKVPGYSINQNDRLRDIEASLARLDALTSGLLEQLVISHLRLVDAHLSFLDQQAKSGANRPCEQQPAPS